MLLEEPAADKKEQHRQCLKRLLRLTRLLHSMAADPEFPDRSLATELEGRLLQLESSWRMFYEAMPAEQAEKLLAEVFPKWTPSWRRYSIATTRSSRPQEQKRGG